VGRPGRTTHLELLCNIKNARDRDTISMELVDQQRDHQVFVENPQAMEEEGSIRMVVNEQSQEMRAQLGVERRGIRVLLQWLVDGWVRDRERERE